MTLNYVEAYGEKRPCNCGAHTQHRVLGFVWKNPAAKQSDIAQALHLTVANVKITLHRLRSRDLLNICPECFSSSLLGDVCQACGFEPASPDLPLEINFEQQSPTNHLHAGNQLGSQLGKDGYGYSSLGFTSNGLVVKRWIDRAMEDPLLKDVKSQVMEELKRYYPSEAITDYAGKLAIKEVAEFRARYPMLASSQNVRKQLALNVIKRLEFLYPYLARPHLQEVTELQ